jgi:multidrug efflux pump subunit AcrA (membrane-fusion protein)
MSGTLTKVLVDIGSRVRAGQTVALQDTRELDAQVDAATAAVAVAKASLEQAEASLANAKLEYDRSKNPTEKGALARQRLTRRTRRCAPRRRSAILRKRPATGRGLFRRARSVSRRDPHRSDLRRGCRAQLRQRRAGRAGDNKGVVVVADTGELKLQPACQARRRSSESRHAALISVQARPGQTWTGRLVALAPEVDARNRHFQIEVRVQNAGDELLSGMYATAAIETGRVSAGVLVPREAVATRDGALVVFRVADGAVSAVRVSQGLGNETQVQILSGLSAGDQIVADGRKPIEPARHAPGQVDQPASRQ